MKGGYVSAVQTNEIVVRCSTRQSRNVVQTLGGRRSILGWPKWKIPYDGERELAELMSSLRDAGFAFGGAPHGWPPAAVFEHLRVKGLVDGRFVKITWTGDGEVFTKK